MVLDYDTPPPRGFKPSDEAFEYYNLAVSLGYKEYLQKKFGRSIYFKNQDYRSASNMQAAKEFALADGKTYTDTQTRILMVQEEKNKKGDSVFSSFEPTTTLGDVITNIADTIIPSIPEAEATGIYAPDTDTGGFYYGPPEKEDEIITTTTTSTTLPPFAGTIVDVVSKTTPNEPSLSISQITKKAASINWNPTGDGGSPITSYHYVLRNQTTGEEKVQTLMSGVRNSYESNLDSNTNYTAFLIAVNAFGNSPENSIGFKTLTDTTTPTPEPTPTPTPTYDFIIESDGKVRVIRLTGNNAGEEIRLFPSSAQINIDRGYVRLLTEQERAGIITPELKFCVNTYNIRDSGSVYSTHYESITAQKVEELKQTQFVISCDATTLPSEKEVQDFYSFTPLAPEIDTSINSTMVSQSVGAFILKDGRVKGEILYIANQSFNPFYYSKTKNLTSLVQIKSKSGVPIAVKPNGLNFTQTERDERIQIDEAVGNFKELLIDFFVWDSPVSMLIFSDTKQIQVVEQLPPTNGDDEDKFKPCKANYHKDFSGKCVPDDPPGEIPRDKLIDTLKGFLFGTVALSLLARKY